MSLKHPALARLYDLRSHLVEYFSWCLTADASGEVPSRLKHYTIAGLSNRSSSSDAQREGTSFVSKLLKFELDTADWFSSPGGLYTLKAARDGGEAAARTTHEDDLYTVPEQVAELGKFIQRILLAMGASSKGVDGAYSFEEFTEMYIEHIRLAKHLPTKDLRWDHLDRCHNYFLQTLRHFGQQLKARVFCAQPDLKSIATPLLRDADEPVVSMKQWETQHQKTLDLLYDFRGMIPGVAAPLSASSELDDPWTLPRRSQRPKGKQPTANSASKPGVAAPAKGRVTKRAREEDSTPATPFAPGAATWSHLWLANHTELYISGRVWKIRKLAAHLGVKAGQPVCWPVVLSARVGVNKLAHCENVGKAHHEALSSTAHQIPGFNAVELVRDESLGLWRYATEKERNTLNEQRAKHAAAPPTPPSPARGKGRGPPGRGSRGRARGGEGFRQPSIPQVEESTA